MNYNLFKEFIQTYSHSGYKGINRDDALMLELEKVMENNNQFFFIADIIHLQILFTSNRSAQMMGTEPDKVSPERFFEIRHPDEADKHILVRGKIFKAAHDLYYYGKGEMLLSTCSRIRNFEGKFTPLLSQIYFFYTEVPTKTVYMLEVQTVVNKYPKKLWANHHYFGNDMSYFRFPDENLLKTGNMFTDRQFEIIKLVAAGLSSEQIAKKLFLSNYTINTHRANILKKSGKAYISELIHDLQDQGLI